MTTRQTETGCYKVSYDSRGAAQAAIASFSKRSRSAIKMTSYTCQNCGHWHLTSAPQGKNGRGRVTKRGG